MSALRTRWRGLLGTLLATGVIAGFAAVAAAPAAHATFPGSNGPVVFVNSNDDSLHVVDPTAGVDSLICTFSACGSVIDDHLGVTADGRTVAFANITGIATIPITGGGFTQVTTAPCVACDLDPNFTPDGSTIVFERSSTLSRVAATGGAVSSIFGAPPGEVFGNQVSPDGSQVAFIDETSCCHLATIPYNGGAGGLETVRSNGNVFDDMLSWSPDGTKIAVRDTVDCAAIAFVPATASNAVPTCFPNSVNTDYDPQWSPDGTKIVVGDGGGHMGVLNANGIGRTDFSNPTGFDSEFWAVQASTTTTTAPGPTTTTTPTPPCSGTLTGTAFKGASPKPKKALAGVIVAATPVPPGTASSATTNAAGSYSVTVPCGTYTKTSTGPDTKTRVCHFGSKSGPTTATATVTNGSVDIENLFCKKK